MRILFISDNFPPEVNAPASRTYEHAKRWVADGAEVTVITCAPNFPQGKVHEGYRNAWRTVEVIDGIRLVRGKSFITGNEGFVTRILDYVSFMFSAMFFGLFERRPDVVVGTSPQFFAALGAWLLSVFKWRPFVFELRDLWPASIVTVGAMEKGFAIRMLEKLELFLYRRADAIVSVTESFRDDLASRGIDRTKIHVIRNGVDLGRYQPRAASLETKASMGVEGKFVVAYLGTHGMAHALENVVEAAALLQKREDIAFLFVGDGAHKPQAMERASALGLKNVVFHAPVTKEKMPDLWSICDVSLVHLKNDPVFSTVIPSWRRRVGRAGKS
jgi:glycosyltransferase involved in cell wall biosynthesis